MALYTARISSKGQIVIPKRLREILGPRPGDLVQFKPTPEGLVISASRMPREERGSWRDWKGALRGIGQNSLDYLVREHRGEIERDKKRIRAR